MNEVEAFKAWKEGKDIEIFDESNTWHELTRYHSLSVFDTKGVVKFRIKPEPIELSDSDLKDISDLSSLIASCFSVPNIYIEQYSWVHTIYLRNEWGSNMREVVVSRVDGEGLLYYIQISDHDRSNILMTVDIQDDDIDYIKYTFMKKWNHEIQYHLNQAKLKYKNLKSMMVILENNVK